MVPRPPMLPAALGARAEPCSFPHSPPAPCLPVTYLLPLISYISFHSFIMIAICGANGSFSSSRPPASNGIFRHHPRRLPAEVQTTWYV
ncbi:hypothetical protein BDV93DRAFT_227652 [Ceratobasidium sp. AG-I]|nr:hypothetical protein BDV93DRAFT_227652 [Ceratobasidium sp. AG-I]